MDMRARIRSLHEWTGADDRKLLGTYTFDSFGTRGKHEFDSVVRGCIVSNFG